MESDRVMFTALNFYDIYLQLFTLGKCVNSDLLACQNIRRLILIECQTL